MNIKIFISYYNEDKGKMIALRKQIEKHSTLKAIVVADDRKASKLLTEKVKDGIKDCDYLICILTRASIKSQWVNQEIGFATALGKKILPIVESNVLNKLKGFIHKQLDLPYSVRTAGVSPRAQGLQFSKRAKTLIDDILLENGVMPKRVGFESLFPGVWECEYILDGQPGTDLNVEVKGDQYYSNGKLHFTLDDLELDLKKGTLSFTKRDPKDKTLIAQNVLDVVSLNERYQGVENGVTPITYSRTDLSVLQQASNSHATPKDQHSHRGNKLREAHIRHLYRGAYVYHQINGKGKVLRVGPFLNRHRGRSVTIQFEDGRVYVGILNNSKGNYFEWIP